MLTGLSKPDGLESAPVAAIARWEARWEEAARAIVLPPNPYRIEYWANDNSWRCLEATVESRRTYNGSFHVDDKGKRLTGDYGWVEGNEPTRRYYDEEWWDKLPANPAVYWAVIGPRNGESFPNRSAAKTWLVAHIKSKRDGAAWPVTYFTPDGKEV